MLNVVSQISQAGDVLRGMLSYDVQGYFVCKIFMALITFFIAVCDGEDHVVIGIFMCKMLYHSYHKEKMCFVIC